MNRSKIEWCDHTWNPITGCRHNCEYCYAKTMSARFAGDVRLNKMAKKDYKTQAARDSSGDIYILENPMMNETGNALIYPFGFEPTLHLYRSNTLDKLKMGNNIFVGAMADVFGEWVPDEWVDKVIEICLEHPQHNYLFLTKNPRRYVDYGVPTNEFMWYGTTITSMEDVERYNSLPERCNTFVNIEPLLGAIEPEECNELFKNVSWLIIGAETGRRKNKTIPKVEWIKKLLLIADNNAIPVFMKNSLIDIVGEKNMRQEFPEKLKRKTLSRKMQSKLYDTCCVCKEQKKKRDMVTLMARRYRGKQPKQYGFMCVKCYESFCNTNNLKIPKFKNMED